MSQYTELLDLQAETLALEDDSYEENLLETAQRFRGFDEALTSFLGQHGYTGKPEDVSAKACFLQEKFKAAGIKPPRDCKEWFVPDKRIARKTAFQLCFALGLNIAETNAFFQSVLFRRSFDCHTVDELVYYFCIKNGLSYPEAQEIIARIPAPAKGKTIPAGEVLYTGTILAYIDRLKDREKLIAYIKENLGDFRYHNATGMKYIQELWAEIAKQDGLAEKEGSIIRRTHNKYLYKNIKSEDSTGEIAAQEIREYKQEIKPDNYVIADRDASTWIIFSQIFGLANYQESEYAQKYDRSLASVLSGNKLLPLKADYCFPNRQNLDKIMRGELVGDDEIIRKMLIFLVFYTYWARLIISKDDAFYPVKHSDSERCLDTINQRLLDAGYPELYAGNPYDWVFKWALNDENPLIAFRYYMGEVFAAKKEEPQS